MLSSNSHRSWLPWLLALVILLTITGSIVHLITESWWFQSVGYGSVFWTRLRWQLGLGLVGFGMTALWLGGNYRLALRITRDRGYRFLGRYSSGEQRRQLQQGIHWVSLGGILLLSLGSGLAAARG